MSAQILRKRRTLAIKRLALAVIGLSFFVVSATTFGADVGIANLSAVAAVLGGPPRGGTPDKASSDQCEARSATPIIENVDLASGLRSIAANPGQPGAPVVIRSGIVPGRQRHQLLLSEQISGVSEKLSFVEACCGFPANIRAYTWLGPCDGAQPRHGAQDISSTTARGATASMAPGNDKLPG
jgi:hypothetical protein